MFAETTSLTVSAQAVVGPCVLSALSIYLSCVYVFVFVSEVTAAGANLNAPP